MGKSSFVHSYLALLDNLGTGYYTWFHYCAMVQAILFVSEHRKA